MMKKNFLLIDIHRNHDYDFIEQQISIPLTTVRPPSFLKQKQLCLLLGCLKVLRLSSKKNSIVCINDFQAVICSLLCSWFHLKRKIVCINIHLNEKDIHNDKLICKLYKKALKQEDFHATVTSMKYGEWLNKKLRTKVKFTLLRDVFHESYHTDFNELYNNAVFCGGCKEIDWELIIDVAKEMPETPFHLVLPTKMKDYHKMPLPKNVTLYKNLSSEKFYYLMCESSLLCMPLNTDSPVGLSVIFHAAANEIMTITTDTVVTREYLCNGRGMLLKNDIIQWKGCIDHFLGDTYHRRKYAKNLHKFLRDECSESNYVNRIKSLVCDDKLEEEN